MSSPDENRYLTDEYKAKLAAISQPGQDSEDAEALFLQHCREFSRFFIEGTPVDLIRRAALQKTERALK